VEDVTEKDTANHGILMLEKYSSPQRAKETARFFKTEVGGYGYGDVFLGISIPNLRKLIPTVEKVQLVTLIQSKYHEERMLGLFALQVFTKKDPALVSIYLENFKFINNWDLVDCSAPFFGKYWFETGNTHLLEHFAKSDHLWTRRIAMVATLGCMRCGDTVQVRKIARLLLKDKHDLMHKAVGWMLREYGKLDVDGLRLFLTDNYDNLPRTSLRYAIERFSREERTIWLEKKFKTTKE
jgi:3-methyladenine DNA glycosylase AlkD